MTANLKNREEGFPRWRLHTTRLASVSRSFASYLKTLQLTYSTFVPLTSVSVSVQYMPHAVQPVLYCHVMKNRASFGNWKFTLLSASSKNDSASSKLAICMEHTAFPLRIRLVIWYFSEKSWNMRYASCIFEPPYFIKLYTS